MQADVASCSRRSKRLQNKLQKKIKSGTCNVCSAPCSSCMHNIQTRSVMESNNADGLAEEASFTNVGIQHIGKNRPNNDHKHAASETSNIYNTSLSHDSSSENAQSKSKRLNDDPSYDAVEMPVKEPSDGAVRMNDSLGKSSAHATDGNDLASHSSISGLSDRIISLQQLEPSPVEWLGDNLSCISRLENPNAGINDLNIKSNTKSISKVDSSSASCGKGSKRLLGVQSIVDLKDSQHTTEGIYDSISSQKNSTLSLSGDRDDDPISVDCCLKNEPSTVQNPPLEITEDSVELTNRKDIGVTLDAAKSEQGDCKPAVTVAASTAEMDDDIDAKGTGYTSQDTALVSSRKLTSDMSKENDITSVEMLRSEQLKENEKLAAVLITGPSLQNLQVAGSKHDDSDFLEDDVKVCDICGDAGREDKLAICSRCSDGAEHTYCMRIMLDKLPEGDWLCEECQFKEDADKKKLAASENLSGMSKAPSFNKRIQDIETTTKVFPYSDGPLTMTLENVDAFLQPNRMPPETNETNSSGISISNSKNTLVRETSSKSLDASKPNINNSGNQTATSFPSVHARSSIGPNMFKNQARIQSPRGPLNSFSGKAKQQAPEKTSQKTKPDSEPDARKEHDSFLGKSGSFKSTSIGLLSSILDKQRSLLERSSVNASPAASACNPCGNGDKKISLHEIQISDKGSEDLRGWTNEVKQQSCLSKSSHFTSTERPVALDSKPYDVAVKDDVKNLGSKGGDTWNDSSVHRGRDGKSRETFSNSKPAVSTNVRVLRCQKCNEPGHSTQFCSIDKLRLSALKPSCERNPKDMPIKSNRWKDAVQAAVSKNNRIPKSRQPDQPNEMSRLSNALGCGLASKNQSLDPSSCISASGPAYVQDSLKTTTLSNSTFLNGMIPQKHSLEVRCAARVDGVDLTGVSRLNSNLKISPELVLSLVNPSGALVVPELDYIWKGAFRIQNVEKISELCDVQAHLSTRASQNVVKVMEHFPDKVELIEVPCTSTWPLQFHRKSPTEENIALFFFATSTESYENGYKKLLETMLKNDTVLTGSINGVELLIIPSNKLPERSQRWNRLFFLWGVFRLKYPTSESVSSLPNKFSDDKLSAENSNQQLPSTVTSPVVSEKEQSSGLGNKEWAANNKLGNVENYNGQSNNSVADYKVWKKMIDKTQLPNERVSVSHAEELDSFLTEDARQEDSNDNRLTVVGFGKCEASPKDVALPGSVVLPRVSTGTSQPSSSILGVNRNEIRDEPFLDTKMRPLRGVFTSSSQDFSQLEQNAKLKRPYSSLIDLESNPDSDWQKNDSLLFSEERDAKRIKMSTNKLATDDKFDVTASKFPSKTHPMLGSFINEVAQRIVLADDQTLPECSASSEKVFFPVNLGHADLKPVDFIPMAIDSGEPEVPNLELALGAEKKPTKGLFPLLSLTNPEPQEVKPPDPVYMEEDPNQSLSLSLATPSPHQEQPLK